MFSREQIKSVKRELDRIMDEKWLDTHAPQLRNFYDFYSSVMLEADESIQWHHAGQHGLMKVTRTPKMALPTALRIRRLAKDCGLFEEESDTIEGKGEPHGESI